MDNPTSMREREHTARTIDDPIRNLAEALEAVTGNIRKELAQPTTTVERRVWLDRRLALVRDVANEFGLILSF